MQILDDLLGQLIGTREIVQIGQGFVLDPEDIQAGLMARHHEDLEKTFTDEQKEIFEKFHDCWDEYVSLAEAAIFEYAFKLGMQIAIETLIE